MKSILLIVNSIQGHGHYMRMERLTTFMVEKGIDVTVICGKNCPFFKDIKIEVDFTQEDSQHLIQKLGNKNFSSIIIEQFPFGRYIYREFYFEILNKMKANEVICSIRGKTESKNLKRLVEINRILNKYFDKVLIHCDDNYEQIIDGINAKIPLIYTGYISPQIAKSNNERNGRLLISYGSGLDNQRIQELKNQLKDRFEIDEIGYGTRNGFINMGTILSEYSYFIGNAGYNTMLECITHQIPSLLLPIKSQHDQLPRFNKFKKSITYITDNIGELEKLEVKKIPNINLNGLLNTYNIIIDK